MPKTLEQLSVEDLKSLVDLKTPSRWEQNKSLEQYARVIGETLGSTNFDVSQPHINFIEFKFENKDFIIEYRKTNKYEYVPNPKKSPSDFLKIKDVRVIVSIEYKGEDVYFSAISCNGFDFTLGIDCSGNWKEKVELLYERANKRLEDRRQHA